MYFGRKRKYAAKLRAQERKKPSRIISLLLVISMLCGNFVGMSTGAAEMVAYCGMEEHTHSEACYCAVQAEGEAAAETLAAAVPTEETAAETTEETTAPTEETALSVSGGSDAQALIGEYVEKELCCGMEEHKHAIACYSNPEADLETAAIWEATLPEKLSGDWGKDLAEVAKSQLGYAESAANYLVGADGETLMGYSRYGAWYSSYTQDEKQAYADWNVPFLFFCLYYAGVTDFPIEEDCADWTAALAAAELWREAAGEYIPEAGDLVFLDTDDDGAADRAAVVTEYSEDKVTAVESDSEGAVKTVTYDLTEDTQVLGYGDTNEAQEKIEVSGGEDAPQLLANMTWEHGSRLYLDCSETTWWYSEGAVLRIYYQLENGGQKFSDIMTKHSDTLHSIVLPDDMNISGGVIFVRMKSTTAAWDQCWNQYPGQNQGYVSLSDSGESNTFHINNNGTGGYWSGMNDSTGGGGGNTGNTGGVVDINTKPFEPVEGAMYVNATFYDYYTDYEVDGNNRDGKLSWDTQDGSFPSQANWVVFKKLNTALSDYYRTNNVSIPVYVGHFQPDWSGFGIPFSASGLSLYGYKQAGVYGVPSNWTEVDQKYFMSVNNSYMASDATPTSNISAYAAQGLIHSTLGTYGPLTKGSNVTLPLFDSAFITGTNSQNKKLGDVYTKVSFPFTEQVGAGGVKYWTFDSNSTTLEMKKDSNSTGYYLESVDKTENYKNLDSASNKKSEYGFFPFNSGSSEGNANTYNYGFGCRLDIPFRLTSDGQINGQDIVFEFSGDDDVWVFIDGKLVLDIGGAHSKVEGNINFADKVAWVKNAKVNPGTGNTGSNGSTTTGFTLSGKNTDVHTLTMFYMERGMWESNMKITFNFPEENVFSVEKEVDTDTNDVNALFTSDANGGRDCFSDADFTFNIKNMVTHYGTYDADPSTTGFVTPQDEIRDYKTAYDATLKVPYSAKYSHSYILNGEHKETSKTISTTAPTITLSDGESAIFRDQFRRGSYIYLDEQMSDKQKALYDTTWTLYEDGKAVTTFAAGTTIENPTTTPDMEDVSGYVINDGRKEIKDSDTKSGYTNKYYRPADNVIVFRSYKDPDFIHASTDLTAKFVNTVKTGGLKITKLADDESEDISNQSFTFVVRFYNVGGMGLEGTGGAITQTFTLKPNATKTFDGIPVGTKYTIYEMMPDGSLEIVLDRVKVNGVEADYGTTKYATNATADDCYYYDGSPIVANTTTQVTFYNTKSAKTSLTLTKNWTFANGETLLNDSDLLPTSITVQLQRKAKNVDGATWAGVGDPVTITAASDTDTGTPYSWTYTFSDLDKTGTYENESVEWEYQVIELKVGDENVTDGSAGDFKVNYGDVTTKEDDGSFEQTITNAYDPKIDISVNKVWPGINSNDLSAVMVRLERKLISGSWDNSNDVSPVDTVQLTQEAAWSHTFEDQPVYNTSGVQYEYRVVELTGTGENQAVVANDGYIVHDGNLFKVTYSNPNYAGSNAPDTTNWTITNTAQTVNLDITKRSSVMVDGEYPTLDGATFKLEKQTETPDDYTKVGDEVPTSGGGKAQFSSLSCGVYRLTETQAAPGYSLLASPIKIEITANVDGTFMIKVDNGTEQTVHADSNGTYAYGLTVYNKPQLQMPATGGIHGFEFWILGGLLIMAVPLLMYTFIWYRKGGKYLQR